MDNTTFQIIELLALYVSAQLRRDFNETHDPAPKAVIANQILKLGAAMDDLRHEQKGGA